LSNILRKTSFVKWEWAGAEAAFCVFGGDFCVKACDCWQVLEAIGASWGLLGTAGEKTCVESRENLISARIRG